MPNRRVKTANNQSWELGSNAVPNYHSKYLDVVLQSKIDFELDLSKKSVDPNLINQKDKTMYTAKAPHSSNSA